MQREETDFLGVMAESKQDTNERDSSRDTDTFTRARACVEMKEHLVHMPEAE